MEEKTKILRIFPQIAEGGGGMETHIRMLTRLQYKKIQSVCLIYNIGNNVTPNDLQVLQNISLIKIRPEFFGFLIFHLACIAKIIRTQLKADILHLHGDWSSFLFTSFYKLVTHSKIVALSMHDTIQTHGWLKKKLLSYSISKADIVFSTGYETYQWLLPRCKQTVFQPSGVSEEFYKKYKKNKFEKFTIATLCNLVSKKNVAMVVDIAQKLPQYQFFIIGDGIERINIESKINTLGCKNITLLGRLEKEDIAITLHRCHLFLYVSLYEGTPTAVMEAMACGLPVVTSNAGKVESILKNNINGYTINNYEIKNYVEKISDLAQNELLLNSISKNNREAALRFTWEIVADNITREMEETLLSKYGKDEQTT